MLLQKYRALGALGAPDALGAPPGAPCVVGDDGASGALGAPFS